MYEYSKRRKKIPVSQFGLAGRHDFPIPSYEKATCAIQKITRKMESGVLSNVDGRKLIKEHDRILERNPDVAYKEWLKDYHSFTSSLEKLHGKFKDKARVE